MGTRQRLKQFPESELLFSQVAATYIENWPASLLKLSIPHRAIPLSVEERDALLSGPLVTDPCTERKLDCLEARLGTALVDFPGGAFLRLGSRSAKDIGCARVRTSRHAVLALRRSQRIRQDCELARIYNYLPSAFLREWRTIPPWAEFRGFMKQRKLVGLCSYHGKSGLASPPSHLSLDVIEEALRTFFPRFAHSSHLESVVFDTYVHDSEVADDELAVTLIEINPFSPQTDGVFFTWKTPDDFDGSFRGAPND